ncbi:MAG: aspartate carbamoyltransferase catalytic subunit [Bacteroidia bacterium]|nr:aspartate carbamoyltransferase catalytic subunit [Bacteroidia bacterium]
MAGHSALSVRHLLGIAELQPDDFALIFSTADEFYDVLHRPIKKVPSLRELTLATVFFENSTRTKLSFELAAKRLSADVVSFSASASSVAKGETLLDTVQNILAMQVDMVVLRHPNPGAPHFLARHIAAQVVNAGDGRHEHPTQALLDAFSLRQKFGELQGLRVAIVGDILHSRVARSNILALTALGAEVQLCGPPTLIPPHIEAALGITVSHHLSPTLAWADAAIFLRVQHERQEAQYFPSQREYAYLYGLTLERLEALGKPLTILHPGPINRGVELTSDVADHPQAIILDQVTNGVAIRMAVLYLLAGQRG